MNKRWIMIAAAWMVVELSPVWAQGNRPMAPVTDAAQENMNHESMPSMEGMDHEMDDGMGPGDEAPMDMEGMAGMDQKGDDTIRNATVPTGVRDPHAYADGYDFSAISRPHEADEMNFGMLLVDRLEAVRNDSNTSAAYDVQAWYGRDFDRVVLKAEGDVDNGKLQEGRTEVLWGHAVSPFWDAQLGVRYDSGVDPDRSWLAFGVQGLAPYWFEVSATAYASDQGRTALRLDAEYDLLLTQRLILQPRIETGFYGKGDAERALGSGLSDVTAGIRLRYEIVREFAPYIGVEWAGTYGGTADYARAAGDAVDDTRFVAGLRFWF